MHVPANRANLPLCAAPAMQVNSAVTTRPDFGLGILACVRPRRAGAQMCFSKRAWGLTPRTSQVRGIRRFFTGPMADPFDGFHQKPCAPPDGLRRPAVPPFRLEIYDAFAELPRA